ncbi:unnamed protein product, partial [Effrenium voratum]
GNFQGLSAIGRAELSFRRDAALRGRKEPEQRVLKKLPLVEVGEAQREAAFREAQLMRKISRNCPWITQFHEVLTCKAGTVLCLIMEFCSGGDLRGAIRYQREEEGRKFPEEQVLRWAAQMGMALQHCHGRGVLHRDVKPENCFFRCAGGDLLLGDFGISCTLDEHHLAKTCCGSPLYLSPEIVNQEPYSYASDVWSLGVTIYEMAMLVPPFRGTNICQVAFRIVSSTPLPLEDYSEELQQLVASFLAKEPWHRCSLQRALGSAPLASAVQQLLPPPEMDERSRGFVQRFRHTMGVEEEYADDFEIPEDESVESEYCDDFEEASASEASYEPDFEAPSDEEASVPVLSEEELRHQICEELGIEAMAVAESLGVISFLETMLKQR